MSDFVHHIEGGTYRIHVGYGAFSTLNSFLTVDHEHKKKFILCDENTVTHCVPQLVSGVNALKSAGIIEIESGEKAKTINTAQAVWTALAEAGADRNSLLINVGGGVVTDLGGFCAAAYMRGIPFVNIPTTLIGMADAGFGGKNGVDLNSLKNIIGLFKDPSGVFCFPGLLDTLSSDELLSGFAEVMKHGLIADKSHWQAAAETSPEKIDAKLIADSIRIKMKIVDNDPFESGYRKVLNFGHTAGHAIESWYLQEDKMISHGFAVAAGMIIESMLSNHAGLLKTSELNEITANIISRYHGHLPMDFNEAQVIQLMAHDKKNNRGNINFTLLNGIGNSVYDRTFETLVIFEALEKFKKLASDQL